MRGSLLLEDREYGISLMIVKRFRGIVVKRMRRVHGGILLTLLSAARGERGSQIVIDQDTWNEHGTETYEPGMTYPRLRQQAVK